MADNYLEKRMDDYRSGRLTTKARTVIKTTPRLAPNQLLLEYPELKIAVSPALAPELIKEIVRQFRTVGAKVAFSLPDAKEGTDLAQRHGARFYPASKFPQISQIISDLNRQWGGVDVNIVTPEDKLFTVGEAKTITVDKKITTHPIEKLTRSLLIQSHPDLII